jgi:hypothetical protein
MADYSTEERMKERHREAVQQKLREIQELLGPRDCEHGVWSECEEDRGDEACSITETHPRENMMLLHSVVVATFVDINGGRPALSVISGPGQMDYITDGLLFSALYE